MKIIFLPWGGNHFLEKEFSILYCTKQRKIEKLFSEKIIFPPTKHYLSLNA